MPNGSAKALVLALAHVDRARHTVRAVRHVLYVAGVLLVTAGSALAEPGGPEQVGQATPQSTREATQMPESRLLLEGDTLRIGFYGVGKAPYPEDIAPAAVLRALAQHLGVDLQTQGVFWGDYCYFAGITGEAFRFLEFMGLGTAVADRSITERYGNVPTAELYRHALDAAGLGFTLSTQALDQAAWQRQIVESLRDRRTPVIGVGGFGPPEPFLITGYDEGAEVLLGWSHFQGEPKGDRDLSFEPTGQFRLRHWYGAITGVVVVTGKKDRPPLREIYRSALERALSELRTTGGPGDPLGMAAMEAWAAHLERDADYAGFSEAQWGKAQSDHHGTAGDLAERRALAASFLELASRVLPEVKEDLGGAQAAFQGSHDTVYEIWETVAKTGPFDPDLEKFKDPSRRRVIAGLVRRLAELDRRGLRFLERALRTGGGKDPGPAIPADALLDGTVVLQKAPVPAPTEALPWAPENIAIANAVGMLRVFLGEPFGPLNEAERAQGKLDYVLWMGYSGAAFGLLGDGPEGANLPLIFAALGYDYELWLSGQLAHETGLPCRVWGWDDNLRRRIFWNLRDRRLPVLLFNCGPWPDWWLITQGEHWGALRGYGGSNGEGYRPNDPLDHPNNPLRPVHLFEGVKNRQAWAINVTAKRTEPKPALEELYRRAVAWGATRLAQPRMALLDVAGSTFTSTRPYQDWAEMMCTDALFPAAEPDALKARREQFEGHEVELAERRFYGAAFLDLAAIRLERPELREVAAHFRSSHRLMEQIWAQTGGLGATEGHLKYAEVGVRQAIARLLLEIGREESAAAALLSQ